MKFVATLGALIVAAVLLPLPRLLAQTMPSAPTTTTTTAPPVSPVATAAATTAAAADTAKADSKSAFFGYVGVYYGYDFNNPAGLTRPGFIYSENLHNQIAVNLALLGARYTSDRNRGTFAIQTGTYPDANYAAEPGIFKNIYDAWDGVKVAQHPWLDAGIFLSHIGLEGPNSRDNLTLTRSIMADNSPYYEAGAKLTYDPGKKWLVSVLAINGWQIIRDRNQNEVLDTQVQFRPGSRWVLNSSAFVWRGLQSARFGGPAAALFPRFLRDRRPLDQVENRGCVQCWLTSPRPQRRRLLRLARRLAHRAPPHLGARRHSEAGSVLPPPCRGAGPHPRWRAQHAGLRIPARAPRDSARRSQAVRGPERGLFIEENPEEDQRGRYCAAGVNILIAGYCQEL